MTTFCIAFYESYLTMVNNVPSFSVSEANIAAGHPPPTTPAPGGERREAARRCQQSQGESSVAEP
jgi:hypothetical protein